MPQNIKKEFVKDPDVLPLEHIIKFESEGFADSVVVQKRDYRLQA